MTEPEDNFSSQADEVEALAAIYGDEWCLLDDVYRVYCIQITDGGERPRYQVCLQVTMPPEYPGSSPPHYQLNAPWLRGDERMELTNALEEIYLENLGESIIYMWVERIREFLVSKSDHESSQPAASGKRVVNMTTETDHGLDGDEFECHNDEAAAVIVELPSPVRQVFECPLIHHSGTVTERRSTFQGHLAPVFHKEQVQLVMEKLYENKKIANATHNIMAYRIYQENPSPVFMQGCDDDGETAAGSRLSHLLQILDARNVIVVVSRWYGGILLGPDRFKLINNSARSILEEHGYIKEKDDKKKPRSNKK